MESNRGSLGSSEKYEVLTQYLPVTFPISLNPSLIGIAAPSAGTKFWSATYLFTITLKVHVPGVFGGRPNKFPMSVSLGNQLALCLTMFAQVQLLHPARAAGVDSQPGVLPCEDGGQCIELTPMTWVFNREK